MNWYQVIKSDLINNEGDTVYRLYSMREIKEGEHFGLYMSEFVDCYINMKNNISVKG